MLKSLDIIENVDKFVVYNSELIINSSCKVVNHSKKSLIAEFKNKDRYNRVAKFFIWDDNLVFSDIMEGELFIFKNGEFKNIDYHFVDVLDESNILVLDRESNKYLVLNKSFEVKWKADKVSVRYLFCLTLDVFCFLLKDSEDNLSIKAHNKLTGVVEWTYDCSNYKSISFLGDANGLLYLRASDKKIGTIHATYLVLDLKNGKQKDDIDFGAIRTIPLKGRLRMDTESSKFVHVTGEFDLISHKVNLRSHFLIDENKPATVGHHIVGIWNKRYFIDCIKKDSIWDENEKKEIEYPAEILVFDRINDKLVSSTLVDGNDINTTIVEFKLFDDKLYALDTSKNLRIYDFSDYMD